MKKIITCTLLAAAASLALPALANPTFGTSGEGHTGAQTSSTSFVYDATTPSAAPVYTTALIRDHETEVHGVLADTTFIVPAGVVSAKVAANYAGTNSSGLEATFSANTNSVSSANTVATTLTSGDKLHILLQNTAGGALNAGATTVTYNVTTYTD